jgi:Cu2+-exporting ATPase
MHDHRPDHQHAAEAEVMSPPTAGGEQEMAHAHDRHAGHTPEMFRNRFVVCLVLTIPILYFSSHVQDLLGYRAITFPGSEWVSPLLAVILYVYGGGVFLQGALWELRAGVPGMMTLVALAITVAFAYSLAVTLGLQGTPFYWELATLIDVMLLGHWLELTSVQGASRALQHLAALIPPVAHVYVNGKVEDVPVQSLRPGVRVLIRPGEQIPADGIVKEGTSSVNEAFLTGESLPVPKGPGDEVVAGAVNGDGALTVEVTRTGEQTTLSQIVRLVRESERSRSRYQALADRAAFWLVVIAVVVGSVTFVGWLVLGAPLAFAVTRSVTVLVIACPHALGLAIPLVIVNATGLSARHGILVRNREAFERAKDLDVVAFDKTGTLTEARFGVRGIYAAELPTSEALRLAASLEVFSEHSLARALVEEASNRGIHPEAVRDFRAYPGLGVEGTIDGRRYRIGRPEWVMKAAAPLPAELAAGLSDAESRGESSIILATDEKPLAVFTLADRIRETSRAAVAKLQAMGLDVVMVTGDSEAVARTVARELGIRQFYARVLPGEKARIVDQFRASGRAIAFVGDGINDAPALVAADLGIAIGAGTNVAIESADLVLVESDPLDVPRALSLARITYAKMVQNLFWATGYNAIAIPLAAGVAAPWGIVLSPAVGALLMSLSTVIVAINATLLRRAQLS